MEPPPPPPPATPSAAVRVLSRTPPPASPNPSPGPGAGAPSHDGVVAVGFVGAAGTARLADRILDAHVFSPGGSAGSLAGSVRYHRDGDKRMVFLHLTHPPTPMETGGIAGTGDLKEMLFIFSIVVDALKRLDTLRVRHVGGDMFQSIPSGDAIFMKWVLTTWTNGECAAILGNCYRALPAGGKVIACEPVVPEETDGSTRTRALLENDIFVMTTYRTQGRESSEDEFRRLGGAAGFTAFRAIYLDPFYAVLEYTKN